MFTCYNYIYNFNIHNLNRRTNSTLIKKNSMCVLRIASQFRVVGLCCHVYVEVMKT